MCLGSILPNNISKCYDILRWNPQKYFPKLYPLRVFFSNIDLYWCLLVVCFHFYDLWSLWHWLISTKKKMTDLSSFVFGLLRMIRVASYCAEIVHKFLMSCINGYLVMHIYNTRTYFLQVSEFVYYFEILHMPIPEGNVHLI
jgi:hypothetical protein